MAEEKQVAKKVEIPRIHEGDRFGLAEHTNFVHHAKVEDIIKREDVLNPEFWSHVSAKITQGDEIKLRNDSFTFYARLLVIDCGSGFVKTHVLEWHELTGKAAAANQSAVDAADYEIQFKGSNRLHIVIRTTDQTVLKEGLRSKIDAQAWLDEFLANGPRVEKKAA